MDDRKNAPQLRALVLTENPEDSMWLLRGVPLGAARRGLLGWAMTAASLDAIAPLQVMEVTARVLCRCARVTFLHSLPISDAPAPKWLDVAHGQATALRPGGWRRLFARKPSFPLICTTSPTTAIQLFLTGGFDWSQRGQLVLLSDREAPPPRLSYQLFLDLWQGRAPPASETLVQQAGLSGFVSPAVDGNFAQIVAFAEPLWQSLLQAWVEECAAAGIDWRQAGEAEFKKTRWFLDPLPEDAA